MARAIRESQHDAFLRRQGGKAWRLAHCVYSNLPQHKYLDLSAMASIRLVSTSTMPLCVSIVVYDANSCLQHPLRPSLNLAS